MSDHLQKLESGDEWLNRALDRAQINEFLDFKQHEVRVAVNMDKTRQGYDENYYSVERTVEETSAIQNILGHIAAGELKIKDREITTAKLEMIQGRNLSHLLVNSRKVFGDSKEMKTVKDAITQLEAAMAENAHFPMTKKGAARIAALYETAINACQHYCDVKKPNTTAGKIRKNKISMTLERLIEEADKIELGRRIIEEGRSEAKQIMSGQDLLSLAAMQNFADIMAPKQQVDTISAYEDDLFEENLRFEAEKEAYETFREEKMAGKGIVAGIFSWFSSYSDEDEKKEKEEEAQRNRELQEKEVEFNAKKAVHEEKESLLKGRIRAEKDKMRKEADAADAAARDRKERLERQAEEVAKLPSGVSSIVDILATGRAPSTLIKDKKNLTAAERARISEFLAAYDILKGFEGKKNIIRAVRFNGVRVRFVQDRFGNFSIECGEAKLPVALSAAQMTANLTDDIIANRSMYGNNAATSVMGAFTDEVSQMSRSELLHGRAYATEILHEETGIPKTLLNNVEWKKLQSWALDALSGHLPQDFATQVEQLNEARKKLDINTVLNQELMRVDGRPEGVVFAYEEDKKESKWEENEEKVRNLLADMIFTQETWVADELKLLPGERLCRVFAAHPDALAIIVSDQFRDKAAKPVGIIEGMIDQLPLFVMGDEAVGSLKSEMQKVLDNLRDMILARVEEETKEKSFFEKALAKGALSQQRLVQPVLVNMLKAPDKELLARFADIDRKIDIAVSDNMEAIQGAFDECVLQMFSNKEEKAQEERGEQPKAQAPLDREAAKQARIDKLTADTNEVAAKGNKIKNDVKQLLARKKYLEKHPERPENFEELEEFNPVTGEFYFNNIYEVGGIDSLVRDCKWSYKRHVEDGARKLKQIIEDSAKGKQGQGLFVKNVLMSYFKSMPVLDQRSMLASSIRNSSPVQKMSREQQKGLSSEQKISMMSDMLGGLFKGAGPLFQKMLQGLPTGELAQGLKKAIEDTQDSLAPIPKQIVRNHMDGIIARSNGKIDKIEVVKSLGAASVGQAFLCKTYGPKMKEGKNVVVKLLRPDVRNRMMREKDIMLGAARRTDEADMSRAEVEQKRASGEVGGMESTYMGNLQRIEEELDLTIEAENCRKGATYDKAPKESGDKAASLRNQKNRSDAMKLSALVEPTSDCCMMEIAGTKTVKRYMSDIANETRELLAPFCEVVMETDQEGRPVPKKDAEGNVVLLKNEDGSFKLRGDLSHKELKALTAARDILAGRLKDMEERQLALAQLTEKWVKEGIFEEGYYHGDLHAGNIMISDTGVTVIDFGNATTLKPEEQTEITRMMVSATIGDVDMFRSGFHHLLKNTPEEVYQEKRDELTAIIKYVMALADFKSAPERIAVVLTKAQEIGLELPPAIANFSSCQMRMQNTLENMNKALGDLRCNVKKLNEDYLISGNALVYDAMLQLRQSFSNSSPNANHENARKELLERRFVKEDDFKAQVRDRDFAASFKNVYGIETVTATPEFREELKKIEGWLTGRAEVSEEDREKFNKNKKIEDVLVETEKIYTKTISRDYQCFLGELKTMVLIRCFEDQYKLKESFPERYGGEIKDLDDVEGRIHKIFPDGRIDNETFLPKGTGTSEALHALRAAQDKKDTKPEELSLLENALWEAYKNEHGQEFKERNAAKKDRRFETVKKLLPHISETTRLKPERQLLNAKEKWLPGFKTMIDNLTDNPENGEELKSKAEPFFSLYEETVKDMDAFRANKQKLEDAYRELFELIWVAENAEIDQMDKNVKNEVPVNTRKPDSFLHVMGEVMDDYKWTTIARMGYFKAWRMKVKINQVEKDDTMMKVPKHR